MAVARVGTLKPLVGELNGADGQNAKSKAGHLWETLLARASGSRLVPTKNVILLGDANSGKSELITQLHRAAQTPHIGNGRDRLQRKDDGTQGLAYGSGQMDMAATIPELDGLSDASKNELALSYSYLDVRDEDNEDSIMRMGIYQLASDSQKERDLLRYVLTSRSVHNTVAVIVLDWSRPWRFILSLLRWINVLRDAIEQVEAETDDKRAVSDARRDRWTLGKAVVDKCREKLERFLQEYEEPTEAASSPKEDALIQAATASMGRVDSAKRDNTVNSSAMANVLLSLGEGMLTDNLGIPIIFVCTKSDYIDVLERERGFKDEDFDFIQRTLRSICLRFGASLIYTSLHRPETVSTLYHYLVSRLLSTPMIEANDQGLDSGDDAEAGEASDNATPGTNKSSSQRATASAGSRYLFRHRANIVDRDRVIVPAGWDSIAKIRYLRDSFDVTLVQSAWKQDEERYCKYIKESKMLLEGSAEAEATIEAGGDEQSSLVSLYGEVVPTPGRTASASEAAAAAAQAIMTGMVVADGDQDFMEKLFAAQEERMRADGEEPMGGLDVRSRSSTVSKFMSGLKARATEGDATGNVLTTAVDLQDQQQQQQQQQPPPPLQPSSSSPVALATATAARSAGAGTTKSTAHKPAVNVSSGFEALRSKLGTSAAGDVSGLVSGWGEESQRTTPAGVAAASMASSAATIRTGVIPSRTASASRRTSGIGTPTGSTTPAGTSGTTVGAKASTRTQELNSFFQNLLGKKGTAMSAGGAAGGGTGGGAGSPRPTVGGSGGAKATTAGGGDSKSLGGDS